MSEYEIEKGLSYDNAIKVIELAEEAGVITLDFARKVLEQDGFSVVATSKSILDTRTRKLDP